MYFAQCCTLHVFFDVDMQVTAALCEVTGTTRAHVRELYHQAGDLGDVAQVSYGGAGFRV